MPPPGAWVATPLAEPSLRLQAASAAEIAERWSGPDAIGWEGTIDGAPFVVERGRRETTASCMASSPTSEARPPRGPARSTTSRPTPARCGARPRTRPSSRGGGWCSTRCCSRLRCCGATRRCTPAPIATPDGALAIAATTGGGKSTLLCELLSDGWALMTDDVLVLESRGEGAPLAHPGAAADDRAGGHLPAAGGADRVRRRGALGRRARAAGRDPAERAGRVEPRPGPGHVAAPSRDPLAVLIGSLLRFPRVPERERTRFEMAGAIAAHVPIWELSADPSVTPGTLAGLLRAELIGTPGTP